MKIQIVGRENSFQKSLLENVLKAIKELDIDCHLEVVNDVKDIIKFEEKQIIITPALIVDDHLLCEGHLWEKEHIKHYLSNFLKDK